MAKKSVANNPWHLLRWPRVGVVDVGSNAIRASVADITNNEIFESETYRFAVRLGKDVFRKERTISLETQANLIEVFSQIKKIFDENQVDSYRAVATSALRSAKNRNKILKRLTAHTGMQLELIDSHAEGRLVGYSLHPKFLVEWTLLLDLGGGSLEMALYHRGDLMKMTSLPLGAVRMLQKASRDKAPDFSADIARACEKDAFFRYFFHQKIKNLHVVGSGGNIRSLFRLTKRVLHRPSRQNAVVSRDDIAHLIKRLEKMSPRQRQKKFMLPPDRADVIVPAAYTFHDLLWYIGISKIYVPSRVSLRRGLLMEYQKKI